MIQINLDKAKQIAHEIRRQKRAEEFAPHDDVIAKRLPGETEAEAARAAIRAKFAAMQAAIDVAATADEIKVALP